MDPGETKIFFAILLAAGIIGIILIYFIISIVSNQRKYLRLKQQQLVTEISTLECERKRIVTDLHDDLGPLLSVVKFQVSNLSTTLQQDIKLIEKASVNLDDILHRIREICNQMMPQVLIRKGLFTAISEFIGEIDSRTSMKIEFSYHPVYISPAAEIHVYRMLQEIVTNAVKHSDATHLYIDIRVKNEKLILEISDDGIGFNTVAILKESNGLGLKNILNRAQILRGDIYLDSSPEKGTIYTIEIPLTCNDPQNTTGNSG